MKRTGNSKDLQSEFGKELVLNHATLGRAGELLAPRYDEAQEKLEAHLKSLNETPDALASLARMALVAPDVALRQLPEGIDPNAALLVLRALVSQADRPNLISRDPNQPISAYVTEDAVDAGFTFQGLNGVLRAQSELAKVKLTSS